MADFTDSSESLVIVVDVETEAAKKKLKQWNKELSKAATDAEKAQKLLSIANEKIFLKKGSSKEKAEYRKEISKIKAEARRLYDKLTSKPERELGDVNATTAKTRDFTDRSIDLVRDADKVSWKEKTGLEERYYSSVEKGFKRVKKTITDADDAEEKVVETLSRIKGTFVESGKMLGTPLLETKESDKTKTRTQEIANGFKTVREYIKLANGELYLMAEKTSKVEKQNKKTFKDKVFDNIGKNLKKQTKSFGNIFKRIGSIITYRIARTILSAFTNAIKQGFELLSQDNSTLGSIKDTFSSISTTMQVSLTTILIPLFETLANLLKPIADDFLNFANAISYANAKLNGQSQYFELSKEKIDAYTKSLKNSNKQLSELDKFATLNGNSKADLGNYVDIADASKEIVENQDEYQKIVDFVQTISDIIGVIIKGAKDLFEFVRDNINWLVPAIALVVTAMNPLLGFLSSLITLLSDASTGAKLLAAFCMTLAGALIGVGIAKTFAFNPVAGLAIGAAAGALFATILGTVGDINNGLNPFRAPSLNLSGTSLSGSSDLYSGIESASTRAYSSSGATTVRGDVYIDGVKAGKIMESSVYSEGTRVGHFGGKK